MQRGPIVTSVAAVVLALGAGCSAATDTAGQPVAGPSPEPAVTPSTGATSPQPDASPTPTEPSLGPATPTPTPSPIDRTDARVAELLATMSDEELAGQLLLVSVYGGDADEVTSAEAAANRQLYGVDTPAEVVQRLGPGGIIFMGPDPADGQHAGRGPGNVTDPRRVPAFVDGLQAATEVPLLVAIDQEHGPVVRLGEPFTRFPAAMALGAVADPALARRVAAASATELAAAGINVNLAPVADVNTEPANPVIGRRSPGQDPGRSSDLVAALVAGIQQDAGIAATVKHFPGHGDTTVDSHDALPTVDATLGDLRTGALPTFRAAIEAGVGLVMPGHLLLPAVDPDHPATMSERLLGDLLREELGFDGVILSDSMRMGAIRNGDDPGTAVAALAAGIDVVLLPPDPRGTRAAIVAALADGTLDRAQVLASVERVLRLKHDLGLLDDHATPTMPGEQALARHDDLAVDVAARAVTVLDGTCPPSLTPDTPVRVSGDDAEAVAGLLTRAGVPVSADAELRIVLWDGRGSPPAATGAMVAVTGSPYAAGRVTNHRSLLVTYGDTHTALRGLVAALRRGAFDATTPVTIPRPGGGAPIPLGHGLTCP